MACCHTFLQRAAALLLHAFRCLLIFVPNGLYNTACVLLQRAICDSYGIIVNVLTSDQHNW